MSWLDAVISIALVGIVCGVILLVRHLKGQGDREVTKFILSGGAFVAAAWVFIKAVNDIRSRFPTPTFSFVYVVVIFVILLVCIVVLKYRSYKEESERPFEYRFIYRKSNDTSNRYTGDEISHFFIDYDISENCFKDQFVSPAIRASISKYRKDHPLDDSSQF